MNLRETPYDKKKAIIIGKHPHKGEKVICVGADIAGGKWGLVFKSDDNGETFFVFDHANVKWI